MSEKGKNIALSSYDDIFKDSETRQMEEQLAEKEVVQEIDLLELHPFKKHPLANSDSSPSRDVTFLANDVRKKSNGMIVCTSITQITPQSIYMSVLSKIKNMLITALCELEEKYGNLDKLGIDVSKKKSFQIETFNSDMNKAVFNISIPNEAENKKQPWYSKVGWNIVVPIFTAIIGAVIAAIMIKILGF